MLNINNITYRYGRKRPAAISDFSLEIEEGGIYGLLGPNGAGKSTLLYLITGALLPQQGNVTIGGIDTRLRKPSLLSDIYIVPEEINMPAMKAERYATVYSPFYPNFSMQTMARCMEEFGIEGTTKLKNMSMGQKKKVAISFAFACGTRYLLMDEPTNGLDIPGKATFRRMAAEMMTDGKTMIISTHQVRDLELLLDHVLVMDSNRLLLSASITEIQKKLSFVSSADRMLLQNALASAPSASGFDMMLPNDTDAETSVNLELLFGYTLNHPEEMSRIFLTPTPPTI